MIGHSGQKATELKGANCVKTLPRGPYSFCGHRPLMETIWAMLMASHGLGRQSHCSWRALGVGTTYAPEAQ